MRVLHITALDYGGAGLCACRIHKAIQQQGVESNVLVLKKTSQDKSVVSVVFLKWFVFRALNKILRLIHLNITEYNKIFRLSQMSGTTLSSPHSIFDISQHSLVKSADLIHLHYVANFLDWKSFFSKVDKPIVWTLHDEYLFYGIAHYSQSVLKDNCYERKYYTLKERLLACKKNMGIVFLSQMMYDQYVDHPFIKNAAKIVINNSVDTEIFTIREKIKSRKKQGIKDTDIVLVLVAYDISDQRKGLITLIKAVESINNDKIKILAVGRNSGNITSSQLLTTGSINSQEELSYVYSAADYFVMPSTQEAFAQTPIEAMACGLPAIVFPVSGTDELINENNGVKCKEFTVESLIEGLQKAFNTKYDSTYIRNYVKENFSPSVISQKYIKFYKEMVNDRNN